MSSTTPSASSASSQEGYLPPHSTEVVPAPPSATKLSLHAEPEFSSLSHTTDPTLDLVISLRAPALPLEDSDDDKKKQRKPIDVVFLIDRSGSMGSMATPNRTKMQLVKDTLTFAFTLLKSDDRVAVVSFDNEISVVSDFVAVDDMGKQSLTQKVQHGIDPRGATNISGGLLRALQLMQQRGESGNSVAAVIMLTDGLANNGITDADGICSATAAALQSQPSLVTVHTMGFGSDHNANMLSAIAESGHGIYNYISNADALPAAFSSVLGGLLTVVAQNIRIELTVPAALSAAGVTISQLRTKYEHSIHASGHSAHVEITDMFAEESRDIVVSLALPAAVFASVPALNTQLLAVEASAFNVIESVMDQLRCQVQTGLCAEVSPADRHGSRVVDVHRNRAVCSDALLKAMRLGDAGGIVEARKVLQTAIDSILASRTHEDQLCKDLVEDLRTCLNALKDPTSYASSASTAMNSCWQAHSAQRCNAAPTMMPNPFAAPSPFATTSAGAPPLLSPPMRYSNAMQAQQYSAFGAAQCSSEAAAPSYPSSSSAASPYIRPSPAGLRNAVPTYVPPPPSFGFGASSYNHLSQLPRPPMSAMSPPAPVLAFSMRNASPPAGPPSPPPPPCAAPASAFSMNNASPPPSPPPVAAPAVQFVNRQLS